jgi:hypothetical protein
MPSVFLSYARADLEVVESLVQALAGQRTDGQEISIWHDQEKLYGGQKWPKELGQAIAKNDLFLLAWSQNAAESHFVEFEWNAAIALKKPIIPCVLDNTPLPDLLRAIQSIPANDIKRLLSAFQARAGLADTTRHIEVIEDLDRITAVDPQEAIRAAKQVFNEHQSVIGGSLYRAGRDIHVTVGPTSPQPVKSGLGKWWLVAGLSASVLAAVTLASRLPTDWTRFIPPLDEEIFEQPLGGFIRDAESNQYVPLALVTVPQFGEEAATHTNAQGYFLIMIRAPKQANVRLIARKDGYADYSAEVVLGDSRMEFALRKLPP